MSDDPSTKPSDPIVARGWLSAENVKWLVATLVIPVVAVWWNREADKRAEVTRTADVHLADARRDADELTALLPSLASEKEEIRGVALLILQGLVASDANRESQLKSTLDGIEALASRQAASANPDEKKIGVRTVEVLAGGDSKAQPLLDQPPGTSVAASSATVASTFPRVAYIQVYSPEQVGAARKLADALRLEGVAVPGIENVLSRKGPSMLRFAQRIKVGVRFFHPEDKSSAEGVAGVVRRLFPSDPQPSVQAVAGAPATPLGQVEVWFPCLGPPGQDTCS